MLLDDDQVGSRPKDIQRVLVCVYVPSNSIADDKTIGSQRAATKQPKTCVHLWSMSFQNLWLYVHQQGEEEEGEILGHQPPLPVEEKATVRSHERV